MRAQLQRPRVGCRLETMEPDPMCSLITGRARISNTAIIHCSLSAFPVTHPAADRPEAKPAPGKDRATRELWERFGWG